jgi:hypothetical protein
MLPAASHHQKKEFFVGKHISHGLAYTPLRVLWPVPARKR